MSDVRDQLTNALHQLGGTATLGDLASATALPAGTIRAHILAVVSGTGGRVAVSDQGILVYSLARTRRPRDHARLRALGRALYRAVQTLYFGGLVLFLLAYFVFYVALLFAIAIAGVAMLFSGDGCDCDCDCGGCDCGGCDCSGCDLCVCPDRKSKAAGSPRQQRRLQRRAERADHREARRARFAERRRRRGERRQARLRALRSRLGMSVAPAVLGLSLERDQVTKKPSRLRSVHAFVFGPPSAPVDPQARTRNLIAYVRESGGCLTAADVASLTALDLERADALALDLAVQYEGDVEVSEDGALIYVFEELAATAGEDLDFLDWLSQQGTVTVSEAARHLGVDAATARAHLERAARRHGGRFVHGAESRVVFNDPRLERNLNQAARLRDYTYAWDRLATSPAVLGVPAGHRGWIIGFTLLNLAMSTALMLIGRNPDGSVTLFEQDWGPLLSYSSDILVLGALPFAFSLGVFLIPLVRLFARMVGDRIRLRRNAWRVFLLALFHRLEDSDRVTAEHILIDLDLPPMKDLRRTARALLERAVRDYEGSVDPEGYDEHGGHTYVFERLHTELTSAAHARLEVDMSALRVDKIVYDSAR
ncbi:hypothetical protein [Haliangium sp.]|uniref:hypothetical protein n=1 Tax=Haliangium sp. TaxID=2663208 RepID=UPI003D0E3F3C